MCLIWEEVLEVPAPDLGVSVGGVPAGSVGRLLLVCASLRLSSCQPGHCHGLVPYRYIMIWPILALNSILKDALKPVALPELSRVTA